MTNLPPIHREVFVDADPAVAFDVFTDQIGQWWPLAEHGVYGGQSTVAFEEGRLIERSAGGATSVWGTVTQWAPGQAVRFTWHPGKTAEDASAVSVSFTQRGNGTLVVLEHSCWEAFADPETARSEYGQGWPAVLGRFAGCVAVSAPWTWVALMHTPGPAAQEGTPIFQDPRFPDHVAFLRRMDEMGYLVAAGPFTDAGGAGMTVLRLPGADRHDEAVRLATHEDSAVRSGLLQVEVRPWDVLLHSGARPVP